MSQTFTTQLDTVATVPLKFTDLTGAPASPPPGGSVAVDNEAILTCTLAADDTSIAITAVAEGAATVTYTNGAITAQLVTTVGPATASAVTFDTADATFAPNAPGG